MADVARLSIAPHSVEAEQALLGGLMLDATAWARTASLVAAADFYRPDHRLIFAACAALKAAQLPLDVVTVADYLESRGALAEAGGIGYIGRIINDTPGAANVEAYAQVIRDRAGLRRLKSVADGILQTVADPDGRTAAELIADGQRALQTIQATARIGTGLVGVSQLVSDLCDDLDRRSEGPSGLRVGLPDFDDLTNGLESGDFVVIGARPSVGKTSVLVNIAATVSATTGVAIFSAEMPARQLMRRSLALQAEIPQGLLRRADKLNKDQWDAIDSATNVIVRRQLWIDDTASPALAHIRAEVTGLKAKAPLGLILVDYVQLVRAPGSNRYEQLRDISYGLKSLAKEIATPIIVLAQLNRGVESREAKRPSTSDLRDSGAIEEAADIVGLLYSEALYDPQFSMPYVMECAIAKNRNGERGECLWSFDAPLSRVTMLDPGAAEQYRRLLKKQTVRVADNL